MQMGEQNMDIVKIDTQYIKLDQLLKWAGVAATGSDAKHLIQSNRVKVNNVLVNERGKKIFPGDCISVEADKKIVFMVEKN